MKKVILGFICLLIIAGISFLIISNLPKDENTETKTQTTKDVTKTKKDTSTTTETKKEETSATSTETKKEETTTKSNETKKDTSSTTTTESKETKGYDVVVSTKEITVKKGKEESFDITFTNPDESSIREYIKCKDQNDIAVVKYSDIENKKIKVDVEGLKVGTTEIEVSDYNYPDIKQIVKVNVVE